MTFTGFIVSLSRTVTVLSFSFEMKSFEAWTWAGSAIAVATKKTQAALSMRSVLVRDA
jgi:hypothetical protein